MHATVAAGFERLTATDHRELFQVNPDLPASAALVRAGCLANSIGRSHGRACEVREALAKAARGPGWNNRRRDIHRFTVPGFYGNGCTLYVAPAAAWAFRRFDPVVGDNLWLREHAGVLDPQPFGIDPDNAA